MVLNQRASQGCGEEAIEGKRAAEGDRTGRDEPYLKKSPVALQITNIYSKPELSKYGPVLVMHVLL